MVYLAPFFLPCDGPSCTGYCMLCIHDQVGSHEIQGTQLHHSVKCNNFTHKLTQPKHRAKGELGIIFPPVPTAATDIFREVNCSSTQRCELFVIFLCSANTETGSTQ